MIDLVWEKALYMLKLDFFIFSGPPIMSYILCCNGTYPPKVILWQTKLFSDQFMAQKLILVHLQISNIGTL